MTATVTTRRTASAVLAEHGSTLLRFVDHVVLDVAVADRITGETVVAAARTSAATAVSYPSLAATAWGRLRVDADVTRVLAAPSEPALRRTPRSQQRSPPRSDRCRSSTGPSGICRRGIDWAPTTSRAPSSSTSFVQAHIIRVTAAMPTAI